MRDCTIFSAYTDYIYGPDTRTEVAHEPGLHPQTSSPAPLALADIIPPQSVRHISREEMHTRVMLNRSQHRESNTVSVPQTTSAQFRPELMYPSLVSEPYSELHRPQTDRQPRPTHLRSSSATDVDEYMPPRAIRNNGMLSPAASPSPAYAHPSQGPQQHPSMFPAPAVHGSAQETINLVQPLAHPQNTVPFTSSAPVMQPLPQPADLRCLAALASQDQQEGFFISDELRRHVNARLPEYWRHMCTVRNPKRTPVDRQLARDAIEAIQRDLGEVGQAYLKVMVGKMVSAFFEGRDALSVTFNNTRHECESRQ